MICHLPSALGDYVGGQLLQQASGLSLREAFADLDQRAPGLAFRIVDEAGRLRPHIKVWVDGKVREDLDAPLEAEAEVHVMLALSGG